MADSFDEELFETRLEALKDTQEGIQQMSSWCLQQRSHHKKIVTCWLNVFKRVRVEHRLTLFYLANDVIQYSKRKRYEFVESWATALQRATTMVRDEKVKGKILRIFHIWEQREIYSEEYLSDLSGLLNINPQKKTQTHAETSDDFQNNALISNVRECVDLSNTTDKSFKKLPKAPHCDIENIKQQLKDKSHSEDVEKEIERYITYIEAFNKNLQAEIKSRKHVLSNLDKAIKFYANQRGEVKVVVSAYKNFGSRIKLVKKKLDEITPNLPSPIPSPDVNAPSPEPDADLHLPDEQTSISLNLFKGTINGYSSYLDGNLPFDINDFKRDDVNTKSSSQPIEVIGSRSDEESYSTSGMEYYKSESISVYSSGNNVSIPGLNPMPVPAVQSGYSSLARSAQQYSGLLPPPNPPMFGANAGYTSTHMPGYSTENNYHGGSGTNGMPSIMPPPPLPPTALSGDVGVNSGGAAGVGGGGGLSNTPNPASDDFNSTWNMNMSWTSLNSSNVDTPVSPPHFERESHSANAAPLEYSEHDTNLVTTRDVDHRQLHLPPAFVAPTSTKSGLSKEKTRQLDIDHRNLISLTGSPGANDQSFPTHKTGDMDYRTIVSTATTSALTSISNIEKSANSVASLNASKKSSSPQKSNASSSSESQKDEGGGGSRYDPADMVVDMDMSDEDLDDIFREVSKRTDQLDHSQASVVSDEAQQLQASNAENVDEIPTPETGPNSANRPALLDTPGEYMPSNVWDSSNMAQMNVGMSAMGSYAATGSDMDMQNNSGPPQPTNQSWNQMQMNWQNGSIGSIGGGEGRERDSICVPPPPRPPFPPMPFPYPNEYGAGAGGGNEYGGPPNGPNSGGRGRGRGWVYPPQNQYRPRPPRGGAAGGPAFGGSPYFNRGGRGGSGGPGPGMRGGIFRGKFRGNSSWI